MSKTTPFRWWRDDDARYLLRHEHRHFNLSEVPRGDNPELDEFVAHWRDTIGFINPAWSLLPAIEFETLPAQDVEPFIILEEPPKLRPFFAFCQLAPVRGENDSEPPESIDDQEGED